MAVSRHDDEREVHERLRAADCLRNAHNHTAIAYAQLDGADTPATRRRVLRIWLAEEAEKYTPAKALQDRLTEAEADLGRVPVGTLSKHKTHRWTGRHWKEIEG